MSLPVLPILHAGGFSWDEAAVLVVAILAVPAISWFTGRMGKRRSAPPPTSDLGRSPEDPTPSDNTTSERK